MENIERKNIIICASGAVIGGMEVLFSNYVRYLIDEKFNVFLLTKKTGSNIYYRLLKDINDRFTYIYYDNNDVMYSSLKRQSIIRNSVLEQISSLDFSKTYAVCGYFQDIILMMTIFRKTPVRLSMIWPHPLDWSSFNFLNRRKYNFKKTYSQLHLYQRELLILMDKKCANYYTSYSIFNFNNWYFDANLPKRKIQGLPIQNNTGHPFTYHANKEKDTLNILWVGRFDFYKNEAIKKIFRTLERLTKKHDYKFRFNIVGGGLPKFEEDLKKVLKGHSIYVNYLGIVPPDCLNDVFSQNDLGIAMGVTVKQMGGSGLPAILIDSLSSSYNPENCCNWVYEIETGDDGDGLYYHHIGKELPYRRSLYDIIEEIIVNPNLLTEVSKRCKESILENYSYARQYKLMTDRVLSSSFLGEDMPLYRFGFVRRLYHKIRGRL